MESPQTSANSREAILDQLKVQLAKLLKLETTAHLNADTRLVEDLGVDSLGMVDLVITVEETFGVKIKSSTDLSQVKTIGHMADLLAQYFAGERAKA